jgi:hypothetical protein
VAPQRVEVRDRRDTDTPIWHATSKGSEEISCDIARANSSGPEGGLTNVTLVKGPFPLI